MTPKSCPKCKAVGDISNAKDMRELFGIDKSEGEGKSWMCNKCYYFFNDDEAEFPDVEYNFKEMTISQISDLISNNWNSMPEKAYRYIWAMSQIENLNDFYGTENGSEIVSYFLANAKSWQGDVAIDVKKYLNALIKNNKTAEEQQIEKIKQAKTGMPIELTGYATYDKEGKDTCKRFIRKEDAEAYRREMCGE